MSFEKLVRIPVDRIGVIIGKSGKTKHQIEKKCNVNLNIDSETGEALDDSKQKWSLSQLEREKARYDRDMAEAKAESDELAKAIEDFKKL